MTPRFLNISRDLQLPIDFATQAAGIVAKRRRGKTYTASVMAEELVRAGIPFVALDPTCAWWGLRSSADGKRPGLPVVVLGGDHGDLPLEPEAGALIADLVVESPGWYVLDLSLFPSNGAHDRFATDFAERLFRRKAAAELRTPLHLFVDEADAFVPQQPMPDQRRMLGAFDAIVRRGGNRGLGVTLISQRPAVVNKNVLSQCELLVALQITAEADREAVDAWVKGNAGRAQRDEVMGSLATLAIGEAWIYSPSWLSNDDGSLGVLKRVRVRERETFNSSRTPETGDAIAVPKKLADVNLEALRVRLAEAVQRQKDDDPKTLRAEIAQLRKELAAKPAAAPAAPVEVPVPFVPVEAVTAVEAAADELERALAELRKHGTALVKPAPRPPAAPPPTYPPARTGAKTTERPQRPSDRAEFTTPGGQRILDALAWLSMLGLEQGSRVQVALLAKASPTSSTFEGNVGALRNAGLVHYPSGQMLALTPEGRAQAKRPTAPPTTADLHRAVLAHLEGSPARVLQVLLDTHPADVSRAELAERAGASATSSTFEANVSRLRTLGFATSTRPGHVRAADELFLARGRA